MILKILFNVSLLNALLSFGSLSYAQSTDELMSELQNMSPQQQQYLLEAFKQGQSDNSVDNQILSSTDNLTTSQQEQYLPRPKKQLQEGEVPKFGYDLFSGIPQPISSTTKITVPANYLIGVGDEIEILFLGSENRIANLTVNREGSIFVPDIGPVTIAGLTFKEAKELLKTRISNQKIGVEASITMGKLQLIQIFITGDAYNPGAYLVSSLSTLTNALFVSGGVKEIGSLRNISLKRNGKTIITFDLYNFLLNGDNSSDIRLESGDVIFIPPVGQRSTIKGEVVREAVYELIGDESLETVFNYAGGLLPSADKGDIQLNRFSVSNVELIDIDLSEIDAKIFKVKNGDVFVIRPIVEQIKNYVYLDGFLRRPGFIEWKESMTISDALSMKKDILSDTDINYAVLVSETFPKGTMTMRSFDLSLALSNRKSDHNFTLKPRDSLLIFSNKKNDQDKCMFVSDSINKSCLRIQGDEGDPRLSESEEASINEEFIASIMDNYQLTLEEAFFLDKQIREDKNKEKQESFNRMGNRNLILAPYIEIIEKQAVGFKDLNLMSVIGAVQFPGRYPHNDSETIASLLRASGGYINSSFEGAAELVNKTLNNDGEIIFTQTEVNLSTDLNLPIPAEAELYIKEINDDVEFVDISGEVLFPGRYTISKTDTLSSLIDRAGGLTNEAYLKGAFFSRKNLRDLESQRIEEARVRLEQELLLTSTNAIGKLDDTQILQQLSLQASNIEVTGRLVVNLSNIIDGTDADINLASEDVLNIPTQSFDITVIGEVNRQTSHVFSNRKSRDDYIELSGGFTPFADQSGAYVISADGSVFINSSSGFFKGSTGALEPGDTIVVPANIRATNRIKTITEFSNIIYQLSVAAAAVGSFNN